MADQFAPKVHEGVITSGEIKIEGKGKLIVITRWRTTTPPQTHTHAPLILYFSPPSHVLRSGPH